MELSELVGQLDTFFAVKKLQTDPAMSVFLPQVYNAIDFDWQSFFEPDFTSRFNGLMIKGNSPVSTVFCAVFPTPEIIEKFIITARCGEMLFLHHPIDMEAGIPGQRMGAGFLPINPDHLEKIKAKGLSIYACHAPLDTHDKVGTNTAIVEALGGTLIDSFFPYGSGFAGRICEIDPLNTDALIGRLKIIFDVPFLDFAGVKKTKITRLGIIAGGGDDAEMMNYVEGKNCQALLTGEIHTYHSGEWGKENNSKIEKYSQETKMSLIGVSHASSEFLVMKTQMIPYIENTFNLKAEVIPQSIWWR
jgi:putative NIF3 family GTP cyclohydrolase 1 type 2